MMFKKYDNYKDSGLEWLGDIPSEWGVKRVKDIGSVKGRVGWKALKASEYVDKSEYIFIATPNIKYKNIDFKNVNYLTKERYEESPEIMLKSNDIVLTKDGSTLGTVNIIKDLPSKTTVNSSIAVLRFKTINNKFMFYQIKSEYIQNIVKLKKDGAGVPHLFQKDINDFKIVLPPLKTQTKIATYLDTQTQKIDKEIQLLEEKSLKYKELKQTLINETVLRGLDKGVKLKDSGIEWIGDIPEGWEVKRGKDIYKYNKIINKKLECKNVLSLTYNGVINKDYNRASGLNPDSYDTYQFVNTNNLIFKLIDLENIKTSRVGLVHENGIMSSAYIRLKQSNNIFSKYFYYLYFYYYKINLFNNLGGGVRATLNYTGLLNINIIKPPLKDQQKIALYLDKKTQIIDNIIKTISKKIKLLKEFRKTLINDVVTGKVKI